MRHHEIVDSEPLIMLNRCGAEHAALAQICDTFNATANDTLEQIKALLAMPDTPPSNIASLGNIVHRIRSACSTIGAVALDAEFQELATCENNIEAEKQYALVVEVFKSTQEVLRNLLSDIKDS